jgi:Secretion system C-terminal sorting domain
MRNYLICLLFINVISNAQTYKPFPTDSASWGFYINSPSGVSNTKEIVKGDTILGGNNYYKVYSQLNNLIGFYRESGKKVYAKILNYADTSEILLYNFNLNVGDTFYDRRKDVSGTAFIYKYKVTSITASTLTSDVRMQFNFNYAGYQGAATSYSNLGFSCNSFWLEGIGSIKGIFNTRTSAEGTEYFVAAVVSNASFANLICFEHKNLQYMAQSCLTLGLKENETNSNIRFYPNPSSGFLNMQLTDATLSNYNLKLINVLGQEEKIDDLVKQSDIITLNIQQLKKGIYFLQVFDNSKLIHTEKIVKE